MNSCGACTNKKYNCDADLDIDAINWTKVDSGKRFIYKYNSQYDTFTIASYSRSTDEYARSGSLKGREQPCETSIYAKSKELDTAGKSTIVWQLNLETFYPAKSNVYNAYFELHGNKFRISDFSSDNMEPFDTKKTVLQNYTLGNGVTYPLINVLEQDSLLTKTNQPYKLFFAYNHGLVAFETFPLHQLWIVQ